MTVISRVNCRDARTWKSHEQFPPSGSQSESNEVKIQTRTSYLCVVFDRRPPFRISQRSAHLRNAAPDHSSWTSSKQLAFDTWKNPSFLSDGHGRCKIYGRGIFATPNRVHKPIKWCYCERMRFLKHVKCQELMRRHVLVLKIILKPF